MHYGVAVFAAALSVPCIPMASVYTCQSELLCVCQQAQGCSGLDQYLLEEPAETCRANTDTFQATTFRRKIELVGDRLNVTFREARPHFSDLDWYQSGSTDARGLINLSFDNESPRTQFQMLQMVRGDVNRHVWKITGTCEVIE